MGLDLVGRPEAADRAAGPGAAGHRRAPVTPPQDDSRLAAIKERLEKLVPGDQATLVALAQAVADAAGAESVLYNVMRGEVMETAVGWRLPPSSGP